MAYFIQKDFSIGLYNYGSDKDIPENGYQWMLNGRTREGNIKPIPKHEEIADAPEGLKQGIASLGNVIILFVEGRAYYRLFGDTDWIQLGSFLMSTTASKFYTKLVPASTKNFKRVLPSSGNIYDDIQSFPSATVFGSISGLVVQDGVNQPWFIYIDNQTNVVLARQTKSFSQWNNNPLINAREYVPIGTFMMFLNQKLYVVSKDKRQIYQSVSGRPLDFMVNVNSDGNKGASESLAGAISVSFTFDYDPITGIFPSNSADVFVYATRSLIRLIQFDYTKTIFGEPTYREVAKIESGSINDKSIIEVLGDYVGIDRESLVSFNAVSQLNTESKNSIFSKMLTNVLKNIKQTDKVCIGRYDDYLIFSLQSTFGPILAIFDVIQNVWVSFDITSAVRVKEFSILTTDTTKQIFCITYNNKVFQLFASTTETETCFLKTRAFTRENVREHKSQQLKLTFAGGALIDKCRVIEYVDEEYSQTIERPLRFREEGIEYPVRSPVIMPNEVMFSPITLDFARGLAGRKISFIISWTGDAALEEIELTTSDVDRQLSTKQTGEAAKA